MTDPKLIEAVARAIAKVDGVDPDAPSGDHGQFLFWQAIANEAATAALAAIDASGTHWVAPVIVTEAMYDAGSEAEEDMQRTGHGQGVTTIYAAMRTAYLAKPQNQWTPAEAAAESARQKAQLEHLAKPEGNDPRDLDECGWPEDG